MHSRTGLLSAARQPSSLVQEPGSTPRGLKAGDPKAAAPFPPTYDVMRPLTSRLSEPGVVRYCVYTYEQITGGKSWGVLVWVYGMVRWLVIISHRLATK